MIHAPKPTLARSKQTPKIPSEDTGRKLFMKLNEAEKSANPKFCYGSPQNKENILSKKFGNKKALRLS